jgi:hypothetical protein
MTQASCSTGGDQACSMVALAFNAQQAVDADGKL